MIDNAPPKPKIERRDIKPPPERITHLPVEELSRQESSELVDEADKILDELIPERNRPKMDEATTILGIAPQAALRERLHLAHRVAASEKDFEKKRHGKPRSLEEQTDHLLEKLLVFFMLKHGDGTIDFRWGGDIDALSAHPGQDLYHKTDYIMVLPPMFFVRADAATGPDVVAKKTADNLISLQLYGHMGILPFFSYKPLLGPGIQAGGITGAPRIITALSRNSTLELAQKVVRLGRAAHEERGKKNPNRDRILVLEEAIEYDERQLLILEQVALQFKMYEDFISNLRAKLGAEKDEAELELQKLTTNEALSPRAVDIQKKMTALSARIQELSDMEYACRHGKKTTTLAYKERHDVIFEKKKGVTISAKDEEAHRALVTLAKNPSFSTALGSLTTRDFKSPRADKKNDVDPIN